MAARHVPGLVREHPGQFVGILELDEQPGVAEDVLTFGDKGIQLGVVDDIHLDCGGITGRST